MRQFKELATEELLGNLPSEKAEILAFLSALTKVTGSITISKKRMNLEIALSDHTEARAVIGMLKQIYPAEFEVSVEKAKSGVKKGNDVYKVAVPQGICKETLVDLCLMTEDAEGLNSFISGVPKGFSGKKNLLQNYFKGLYLGGGAVYVPSIDTNDKKKDGYHFEFKFEDECMAESVSEVMQSMAINSKVSEWGAYYLAYIKDKDDVLKILAFMELNECVLQLQNIIDERETANSINRASICEAANLDKTFTAASKQLLAIGTIEEEVGLENLSPVLLETARARMEYPQASLSELADILGVSKSCLNHRLRKLVEISEQE